MNKVKTMKELFKKINTFYHSNDVDFYCSLIGPLTMFIIHLISVLIHFDWMIFNYGLYSLMILFIQVLLWASEKFHWKANTYLMSAFATLFLIIPMMVSFVMTILNRESPTYLFEWLIYAYALYATIKTVIAIRKRIIAKNDETIRIYVLSWFGLITALYTIQMLQFRLIRYIEGEQVSDSMYMMQLFTQGFIFLFAVFVVGLFIYRFIKEIKASN